MYYSRSLTRQDKSMNNLKKLAKKTLPILRLSSLVLRKSKLVVAAIAVETIILALEVW